MLYPNPRLQESLTDSAGQESAGAGRHSHARHQDVDQVRPQIHQRLA